MNERHSSVPLLHDLTPHRDLHDPSDQLAPVIAEINKHPRAREVKKDITDPLINGRLISISSPIKE